ncbi:MAG: hypothetical protein FWB86_10135 [Treponema sp.]|nr:hypothetical protein [Treponema sp.]MCL2252261.1 hypothetical protein [Treponema sp.]
MNVKILLKTACKLCLCVLLSACQNIGNANQEVPILSSSNTSAPVSTPANTRTSAAASSNTRDASLQKASTPSFVTTLPNGFIAFQNLVYPQINYYGANLGFFPPKVRDFIINTQFTKDRMERPHMLNPSLRVWWSEDNNKVLMEASYTTASGYVGAGTVEKWGQGANYSGSSAIFDMYGEYAYYHTFKFEYEHSLYVEQLLKTDPAYAEIISFAKKLCAEIEYDWANFSGYSGARARPTPGLRRHVCDGYANEVMEKILQLSSVQAVQKWTSPGHAWNVIKLTDGRTLYFDLTWFDNEHINQETGAVYQTDDYNWTNITFHEHLFRFSNVGYGQRVFHHNVGQFNREIRK